jgi:hypothetical protein
MMKTVYLVVAILAMTAISATHSAWAQKVLGAKVRADAVCTLTGTDLSVNAGLIQRDAPSSGPYVSSVTFSLEENLPNSTSWTPVANSSVLVAVNKQFDLLPAGGRYEVATYDYSNLCSLVSPSASAFHAVVEITVNNAGNENRPGGNVFSARCGDTSPCRQ